MAGQKTYATISDKSISVISAGLGVANNKALKSAFPQSPMYLNEINEAQREQKFTELVLNGIVENGNGFAGTSFNRDYSANGAPYVSKIEEDNEGNKLYSPYTPNPTSPGPGSIDASDKPMHSVPPPTAASIKDKQFGVGLSSVYDPIKSSLLIDREGIVRPLGSSFE
jgi:hypothetical protein